MPRCHVINREATCFIFYIGLGAVGEKIHILVPLCNSFVQLNAPNKQIRDGFKYCLEPLNLSDISDSTKL